MRALLNPRVSPQTTWSIPWRRAELGGMNGHGNARGIAAAQSVLANGGACGRRLLSDAGREQVLRTQADGVDLVLGIPMRWGMGYALSSPTTVTRRCRPSRSTDTSWRRFPRRARARL